MRIPTVTVEFAQTRVQFDKPIASFQMIQSMLAEMYVHLESARALTYATLAQCDGLERGGGGRGHIHKLTAAALFNGAQCLNKVLDMGVQIHGGMGYMRETEINRLYRTNKLLEIGAGTQEVRKMIISGELLR